MNLTVGYSDERWNVPAQIEQRMHFDGGFMFAKLRPGKEGKTKINCCRVQSVETLIQFDADRIVGVQRPCNRNENLCEVRIDSPVTQFVGIGQRGTFDLAAKAHVIELAADRMQAGFDITQAV